MGDDAAILFTSIFYECLLNGHNIWHCFDTAKKSVSKTESFKFILLPLNENHNVCISLPERGDIIHDSEPKPEGNLTNNRYFENGCEVTTKLYQCLHKSPRIPGNVHVMVVSGEANVGKSQVSHIKYTFIHI